MHVSRCCCLNNSRKEWEDMSGRVGEAFNIVKVASTMNEEALRRARGLHDTLFSKGSSQENQGASKVTFMFLCNATHHILGLRGRSQRLGRSRPGTETEERRQRLRNEEKQNNRRLADPVLELWSYWPLGQGLQEERGGDGFNLHSEKALRIGNSARMC